ncbi:UNVERIFIED_CONTAM: hypothetical protein Sindi_2573500 [Sesamum indicum]
MSPPRTRSTPQRHLLSSAGNLPLSAYTREKWRQSLVGSVKQMEYSQNTTKRILRWLEKPEGNGANVPETTGGPRTSGHGQWPIYSARIVGLDGDD